MVTQALPEPTQDERNMALLAHVLMIVTWFIGPLVIYLVKRESRFVSFHALQAVFWQLAYFLVMMVGMGLMFFVMFTTTGPGKPQEPPAAFFLSFFGLWLLIMGFGMVTLVLGIVYGIKASKGEWAAYPVIGGWARRLAGI